MAADDAERPDEGQSVRVDVGLVGGVAHEFADRVVGEQQRPDLLADHLGRLRAQHTPGSTLVGLQLLQQPLELPALVVGSRELGGWGVRRVGDRGDQADQLARSVAVPVGDLLLEHTNGDRGVLGELLGSPRPLQKLPATGAGDLRVEHQRHLRPIVERVDDRQLHRGADPPQQGSPGCQGVPPQGVAEEVPVGHDQHVRFQRAQQRRREGLLTDPA